MLNQSKEDYLKTIYSLRDENGIKSVSIAINLNISKAAVSKMIRRLEQHALVEINHNLKVNLTQKGEKQAKMVLYKYKLIEMFLFNILKINKKNAHKEAHTLEHAFSNETIKKLETFLNIKKINLQNNK